MRQAHKRHRHSRSLRRSDQARVAAPAAAGTPRVGRRIVSGSSGRVAAASRCAGYVATAAAVAIRCADAAAYSALAAWLLSAVAAAGFARVAATGVAATAGGPQRHRFEHRHLGTLCARQRHVDEAAELASTQETVPTRTATRHPERAERSRTDSKLRKREREGSESHRRTAERTGKGNQNTRKESTAMSMARRSTSCRPCMCMMSPRR